MDEHRDNIRIIVFLVARLTVGQLKEELSYKISVRKSVLKLSRKSMNMVGNGVYRKNFHATWNKE